MHSTSAETARLAALAQYEVLGTEPEAEYTEIAALAAQICGTSQGYVTLVGEDTVWHKGLHGHTWHHVARRDSLCPLVVATGGMQVVNDTQLHEVMRLSRAVLEAGLRFYAGAPLVTPAGHVLGTLCVADTEPRMLTEEQKHALEVLARQVMAQMELRRQKAELQRSEGHLRTLVDFTAEILWTTDAAGAVVQDSPSWRKFTGQTYADFQDNGWIHAVHPEDRAQTVANWEQACHTGTNFEHEYRLRHVSGEWRWVLSRGTPLREPDGQISHWVGMIIDISDRKRAQVQREQFFNISGALLVEAGFDGRFQRMNSAWEKLLGWKVAELQAQPWLDFVHPEDRDSTIRAAETLFSGAEVIEFENRYRHCDGSYRWLAWNAVPEMHEERLYCVVQDITGRRNAERQLRAAHDTFLQLIEKAPMGVYLLDSELRFLRLSVGGFRALAGVPQILGRTIDEVMREVWPESVAEPVIGYYHQVLETGVSFVSGLTEERSDREAVESYEYEIQRIVLPNGEFGVVCYFYDVTELNVARQAAERASKAKDDFLAALSHELRTPLTPVLLSVAALRDVETLSPEVREELTMIERNVSLEARLIDDLLDLTRISRGKLQVREEVCDLHLLINLTMEMLREEALSKPVALEFQPEAKRSTLRGDSARLQQVIWNLLRNGIKFTPPHGRVVIRTHDGDADWLCLEVSDNGIGLAEEARELIFQPFEQASREGDHRFGGLGLGLAIARAVVELHHGKIWAESPGLGQGATFKVCLPGAQESITPERTASLVRARGKGEQGDGHGERVLLVEDHAHTLAVLQRLLTRAGYAVTPASSVAAAEEAARGQQFDLVISDLGLPDGTGIEALGRLRALQPTLRGIALSGYGMEEDLERTREAGFAAHLIKPIDFEHLRRTMQAVFGQA